jgi:hypothetical protein
LYLCPRWILVPLHPFDAVLGLLHGEGLQEYNNEEIGNIIILVAKDVPLACTSDFQSVPLLM